MKLFWIDTETTGFDISDAAAFQIAYIFRDGDTTEEKVLTLNPLNDEIKYSQSAGNIHGVSEEEIRSYQPAEEVIPELVESLSRLKNEGDGNKMFLAGYNCIFDWMHLKSLMERYTKSKMDDFFYPEMADVFKQAKKAKAMGKIGSMNLKLTTVCKSLNVSLENAHNALSDIKATRDLGIHLMKMGVPLI